MDEMKKYIKKTDMIEESDFKDFFNNVESTDVLDYYETKHKENIDKLMKFMKNANNNS